MVLSSRDLLASAIRACCLLLLAFGSASSAQETANDAVVPFVLPESGPFKSEDIMIDNQKAISDWYRSAHADQAAEAFSRWDSDEGIRPACSVCHSGEGFRSYHGLDGSGPGIPQEPIPAGGVVDCGTCHNEGLRDIKEVLFPSGVHYPVVGVEAACMTCHQGRTAGATVAAAIEGKDLDTADTSLRFINPHYATAAASWLGGYGGAGYHYDGREYSGLFWHARPVSSCNSCHEPHTLEVDFEPCQTCHQGETPQDIRVSRLSHDGSGNTAVGIAYDIRGNSEALIQMIKDYAESVTGKPILYDGSSHPYFFNDTNGDSVADLADGAPVAYNNWTPRLLRAAYNWKLVSSDLGNFAHNPDYTLELLYDSIEDLAEPLGLDMKDTDILR